LVSCFFLRHSVYIYIYKYMETVVNIQCQPTKIVSCHTVLQLVPFLVTLVLKCDPFFNWNTTGEWR